MAAVTMAQLARELGVSKNTVSLAYQQHPSIPAATRERVFALARLRGYTPNPTIAHLMAELRRRPRNGGPRHTLALCNAFPERRAFRTHPTLPPYVEGCRRRAAERGYGLDEFWLHDPSLDGARLNRILRARGIRGIIIVGLMNENRLPARFAITWEQHACVVTGVRTDQPTLSFCCADHHALVRQAVEEVRRRGYRRPGLAIEEDIDRLVENRFTAGMWAGQQAWPARQRVPAFTEVESARADPAVFYRWLDRHRPDVVLTLYSSVRRWIEARGLRVPADIGLVQLERRRDTPEWAGMDQHNDRTGEAAVDLVIASLHQNEIGVPAFPRAMLIGASWVEGRTLRPRSL